MKNLYECEVHNNEDCELFTYDPEPDEGDSWSSWIDKDGDVHYYCTQCLTAEEEADARAEFGDEVWAVLRRR